MGRPRGFDEAEVLGAAMLTFWERGYARTSIGDLVDATGVSRSSLYSVWGDKDGLFASALDRYEALVVSFVLGPVEAEDADLTSIEQVLRSLVAAAEQAPGAFGCLFSHTASERARIDQDAAARVHEHQRRMQSAYGNALRNAASSLREDLAVDATAAMLTVFTRGLTTQIRAGTARADLDASVSAVLALLSRSSSTNSNLESP